MGAGGRVVQLGGARSNYAVSFNGRSESQVVKKFQGVGTER